jgi:hypothetical protein
MEETLTLILSELQEIKRMLIALTETFVPSSDEEGKMNSSVPSSSEKGEEAEPEPLQRSLFETSSEDGDEF